jgi:ankyrin repeat protein
MSIQRTTMAEHHYMELPVLIFFKPVKFIFELKADINAKDDKGQTPLHYSSERGYSTIIQFLVQHGAVINAKDNEGQTPLHLASKEVNSKIVKFLLEKNLDVNTVDNCGQTSLHLACKYCEFHTKQCLKIMRYLLEQGADREINDKDGKTPFDLIYLPYKVKVDEYLEKATLSFSESDSDSESDAFMGNHLRFFVISVT